LLHDHQKNCVALGSLPKKYMALGLKSLSTPGIEFVWNKASIPVISHKKLLKR